MCDRLLNSGYLIKGRGDDVGKIPALRLLPETYNLKLATNIYFWQKKRDASAV